MDLKTKQGREEEKETAEVEEVEEEEAEEEEKSSLWLEGVFVRRAQCTA